MRTGNNPAKAGLPAYTPNKLGIALLVYIPSLAGYFQNALDILAYQIDSLYATTGQEFDLLVFDNGSCPQAVGTLQGYQAQKRIDWLLLSRHNLGKTGAWNWIFSAMPNEWICYSDSDVLFRPGWLEASCQILEAFPRAGMVSAQPNFFDVLDGTGKAHLALQSDPSFKLGEYKPQPEIVDEYCRGIGADEALTQSFHQKLLPDISAQGTGVRAVIGASHMQFIIPRAVARQVVPLPASKGLYRQETISLDRKIDDLGFLHLSTQENYVFHMGNTINENLLAQVRELTGKAANPAEGLQKRTMKNSSPVYRWMVALAQRPGGNRLLQRIYNFLFRVLYAEN